LRRKPCVRLTYPQALDYIASLAPRGWRLGLDRMQAFIDKLGLSRFVAGERGTQFLHVTGTNGKGSVTAFLQSVLHQSGFAAGGFFSPYVYDIRERVQFNKHLIAPGTLARLTSELMRVAESFNGSSLGAITEFEFKTALGFQFWKEKKCDWVAVEVGLGGRLDSTNVLLPAASTIVSIGLDHTNILGSTYREIAHEKAGVIKPGRPVVVGQMVDEALDEIETEARKKGSLCWIFGKDIVLEPMPGRKFRVHTPVRSYDGLRPGLYGRMQPHNMALAVATLDAAGIEVGPENMTSGVRHVTLPGRFEHRVYQGLDFVLDGAHNAEAAQVLALSLQDKYPARRIVLIAGMVAGHEPTRFFEPLAPLVFSAHIVPIQFHRALPPAEVAVGLHGLGPSVAVHKSLATGLEAACMDASSDGLVVVTGSFYLLGEIVRMMDPRRHDPVQ